MTATPYLLLDHQIIAARYRDLTAAHPGLRVLFAVKACNDPLVLTDLIELGAGFDVASPGELDHVLDLGADPARVTYGNTVKRASAIAHAAERGVHTFAVDTFEELTKIARSDPHAHVVVRISVAQFDAAWPLSDKFGTTPERAVALLTEAARLGLHTAAVSFHVGSHQRDPAAYTSATRAATAVINDAARHGVHVPAVNLGGGFPGYGGTDPLPDIGTYLAAARAGLDGQHLDLWCEPGRYLVADAGTLFTEVLLVTERAGQRWVHIDTGVYGGLLEAQGEGAIRFHVDAGHGPTRAAVLAGPTRDSADVMYTHGTPVPENVTEGDILQIRGAGAYLTATSTEFNGFPLPATVHHR